jgi:serine/threonine-protein kinase
MSDQELNHVENVFHAVLELAPDAREAYLQEACNGDKSLYAEVSSLISAFDSREGFIEEPALNLGLRVLTQSSEQSMVGKTIGPYNVLSRLGKGGMGEVYLAEDTRLGRKVALKFLSQEFVGDNWAKRQLVKEAQAVAMLDHPNICPVYGIEEIEDHLFIVMQYVEGETLAELISENTISLEKVLAFARQIVGALAEAHAHGIIHRDIKPKNIMVTRSDQVKVLDFGLAKTVRQHAGVPDDSVSHLNEVRAGTVSYMSPEQLRGERLDFRSDIFSLGTVLYEMIENVSLFARNNEADTITAILTSELPPLRRSLTQFPQIEPIVRKCLVKDRNNRYHSVSEVSLALSEPIREAKSLLQYKHTWPYPVLIALSLTILILAAFLYVNRPKNNQFTGVNQTTTVSQTLAVLPLGDSTGNADASLTDGFVEALIDKVSVLPNMRVIPFTSTVKYKEKKIDPKQVGKELGWIPSWSAP